MMRSVMLIILVMVMVEYGGGHNENSPGRGRGRTCLKPRGPLGDTYTSGCYKYTCTERKDYILCVNKPNNMFTNCRRTGDRFYWRREIAEQKCCRYQNKVYRPQRRIVRVEDKRHCAVTELTCVKRKGKPRPQIKINTKIKQKCSFSSGGNGESSVKK